MSKTITTVILSMLIVLSLQGTRQVYAAETEIFNEILKKVDGLACTQPEKIQQFYNSKLVIMVDDKRALLKKRVEGYRQMISELKGVKCETQRKLLFGNIGKEVGFVLMDEISSVTSRNTDTDERQHSICSYVFAKEKGDWKITLEHCSSLPDYSINPGDDALYYFHNPIY